MDNAIVLHTLIFILCSFISGVGMLFWLTGHISLTHSLDVVMPTLLFSGILLFKNGDIYIGKVNTVYTAIGSGTIAGIVSIFLGAIVKKIWSKDVLKTASIVLGAFSDKVKGVLSDISDLPDKEKTDDNGSK